MYLASQGRPRGGGGTMDSWEDREKREEEEAFLSIHSKPAAAISFRRRELVRGHEE